MILQMRQIMKEETLKQKFNKTLNREEKLYGMLEFVPPSEIVTKDIQKALNILKNGLLGGDKMSSDSVMEKFDKFIKGHKVVEVERQEKQRIALQAQLQQVHQQNEQMYQGVVRKKIKKEDDGNNLSQNVLLFPRVDNNQKNQQRSNVLNALSGGVSSGQYNNFYNKSSNQQQNNNNNSDQNNQQRFSDNLSQRQNDGNSKGQFGL